MGVLSALSEEAPEAWCVVVLRFFHQLGIMTKIPSDSPPAKAARTTSTKGACQKVPKKKCTATVCWLFSAKAKSVKKMAALSSHIRYFTGDPQSGVAIVASPPGGKCNASARWTRERACQQFFGSGINGFAQCFSRFEMSHPFFRDGDTFSRPGIASHAGRTPVDGEAAEAPNLNPVATHQCVAHGIKKGLDGVFGITVRQLTEPGGQFFDKIASGHGRLAFSGQKHTKVLLSLTLFTSRCCRAWRAAGRPGWSGRRFRARTAGSGKPWLPAGQRCPWL